MPLWLGAMSLSRSRAQPMSHVAEGHMQQPEKNAGAERGNLKLSYAVMCLRD